MCGRVRRGRAVASTRASAATRRSTRASTRCAATAARPTPRRSTAPARRQRDPRVAQGLPARAGSLQPALPAAGDGRLPRPDAPRGRVLADRSERGLRQSARVRRRRRHPLRRQLPRRAGRVRGGQSGARDRRDRRAVRAAHRAADGHEPVGAAAVPGRGRRRELGLHDRAGHRGGARVGEQVARASRFGRFAADVREPGGSRQHGDLRRAAAAADGGQHRGDRRDRAARRRAGRRVAPAARSRRRHCRKRWRMSAASLRSGIATAHSRRISPRCGRRSKPVPTRRWRLSTWRRSGF